MRRAPTTGHLAHPLTHDEQRLYGRMYRQHERLVTMFVGRLRRKYRYVDSNEVMSCVMVGFLKACRAFDPNKGTFSTIFATFAEGEIKHFVRDYNWQVKAPGKVRERGQRAQRLLAEGHTLAEIAEALECSDVELHDALTATSPTDHEVNDFELHVCQRPTPWDYVMAEEADAAV